MQIQDQDQLDALPGADSGGSREAAWQLLCEWTASESLRKHALAVEIAMRAYARQLGADEERWGITGLLHDLDYDRYPEANDHPQIGVQALRDLGYPDDVCAAILGHADKAPRATTMAKVLYAVDELTGFITAVALVRPSKQIAEVSVKSIKKKFKDKAFARGCNREDIAAGAEQLGLDLDQHIAFVLEAMQAEAETLGL